WNSYPPKRSSSYGGCWIGYAGHRSYYLGFRLAYSVRIR
ncbi:MAG: hypothetical protein ACI9X4_002607, partial [Glaciecola sp.]